MQPTILVFCLEDDKEDQFFIKDAFTRVGLTDCQFFSNPREFKAVFNKDIHVCVLDFHLPGTTGAEVLEYILDRNPNCRVTVISGQLTVKTLGELWSIGAKNYVVKEPGWEVKLAKIVKQHIESVTYEITLSNKIKQLLRY